MKNKSKNNNTKKEGFKEVPDDEKIKFLRKRGISIKKYQEEIAMGNIFHEEFTEISREIEWDELWCKMENSKYANEIKLVANGWTNFQGYLSENVKERNIKKIARYTMDNELNANKEWLSKDKKICRLCNKENETLKHILEECEITRLKENWITQLNNNNTITARLSKIDWIRKKKIKIIDKET